MKARQIFRAISATVADHSTVDNRPRQPKPARFEPLEARVLFSGNYVFPTDANIIDVTDYGAIANDGIDDGAAIKAAFEASIATNSRYSSPSFIYVPDGTYHVSDTLEYRTDPTSVWSGWRAGMLLVGQSEAGTKIKLYNNASGFNDPLNPKAILKTGSERATSGGNNDNGDANEGFRHSVINLTIDAGSGNAGAIGIDYNVSNRGTIEDVTIKADAGSGYTGLGLERVPGPGLVKDVTIDGFDYALRTNDSLYSMVFENLTVRNQEVTAIKNGSNTLTFHNLVSENSVQVVDNDWPGGVFIIGGTFTGGASSETAVQSGYAYLRDVSSQGYGTVYNVGGDTLAGGSGTTTVTEFTRYGTQSLYGDPGETLRLNVEATPTYHTDNLSLWRSVVAEGATAYDDSDDDAPAIQAAIDNAAAAGDEIVYLPRGDYNVNSTIVLRGGVKKLMGLQSAIFQGSGFTAGDPLIRFDGGDEDTVVIEHLRIDGILEHNSNKNLSIRHADMEEGYRNTANGTGKVFFEDTIGTISIDHPQQAWGRQINAEFGPYPLIKNTGGDFWILGYKGEGVNGTYIENDGGRLELLGGLAYPTSVVSESIPAIKNIDGDLSVVWRVINNNFRHIIEDTRDGETRSLWANNVSLSGKGPNDANNIGSRYIPIFSSLGQDGSPLGTIDFSAETVTSYSNQDSGSSNVEDGGATLRLTGNSWKKIDFNYTVTADTVLQFEVNASDAGEIIGISLDENNSHGDQTRVFAFGGSQGVPGDMINYTPKYTAGSGWVSYSIPVGDFYTGSINHIGFVGDDDANGSTNVRFRNVKVIESSAPANQAPTDIQLAGKNVDENEPVNTVVGTFTTTDPDPGDTHIYSLVGGETSAFNISGNQLRTSAVFDFESQSSYGITVRTDDGNGGTYDEAYTITVNDIFEPIPESIDFSSETITSYSNQDSGSSAVEDGGATLRLTGNSWKKIAETYTVTTNTILEFEVNADDTGEIIGISLDENNSHGDQQRVFAIGGSQNVPGDMIDYSPKYTAGSGWSSYSIPVGTFYTGNINHVGFVGDDDANGSTNVRFRNVVIRESGAAPASSSHQLTGLSSLTLEAESATTASSQWLTGTEGTRTYRYVPNGGSGQSNYSAGPTAGTPIMSFDFTADLGTYSLDLIGKAATNADNSFWVRVNSGSWARVDLSASNAWVTSSVGSYTLAAGLNTVEVAQREDGTLIDNLVWYI